MSYKHTPGPWHVINLPVYTNRFSIGWTDSRGPIGPLMDLNRGFLTDEEYTANAYLIAATPELLEACEAAHQCITDLIAVIARGASDIVINEALGSLKTDALPLVKKAIAKATTTPGYLATPTPEGFVVEPMKPFNEGSVVGAKPPFNE